MADVRTNNGTLAFYPPRIVAATDDVISEKVPKPPEVPVQGVPLSLFQPVTNALGVLAGAVTLRIDPIPVDVGYPKDIDQISWWLNDKWMANAPIDPTNRDDEFFFNVFLDDLLDTETNEIFYKVHRTSGNETPSTPLWILCSKTLPGGNDVPGTGAHPGLQISLPPELGSPAMIGKDEVEAGVLAIYSYSHMKAYDTITLDINSEQFSVKTDPEDVGERFCALIDQTMFESVGSLDHCPFKYRVRDQLGNFTDDRRWSEIIHANIDLERKFLPKPILREDPDDDMDDPAIVHLDKLDGRPLLVVIAPTTPDFQKGDTVKAFYRLDESAEKPTQPGVITDKFGLLQPCILEIPNDQLVSGARLQVRFEQERPAGTVIGHSRTAEAEVIGEAAPQLKAPNVLQANGTTLAPMNALTKLTIVVPQGDTLPTDLLSVSWIPEPGTHAEGSFTSDPRPISEIGLSIDIAPPLVAFCLGGIATVGYTITRDNGQPQPSDPFILNVQELPQAELIAPRLKEASNAGEGTELNLAELTPEGKMWFSGFPFNAVGQYVWLLFKGTNADGSAYEKYVWAAPFAFVNDDWVRNGYFEATAPYEDLKGLKDETPLIMEMWVAFGKSEDLALAKRFLVRTYIVANGKPLIIDPAEMQLNGLNYYISPLSPYQPDWVRTDYKSPGSSEIRLPTDGTPPYIFFSQNTHIATVDAKTGQVYSVSNGATIIEVRDATGRSGQYPVKCSNVFELFAHYQLLSWGEAHATLRSLNLEPIPFTQTQTQISNPPVDFQFQSRVIGQKTPFFYGTMAINNTALISYLIPSGKSVPPNPISVKDSGVTIGLLPDANLRYSIIGRRAKTPPAT